MNRKDAKEQARARRIEAEQASAERARPTHVPMAELMFKEGYARAARRR